MGIFGIIGNLLGIGKDALERRHKIKAARQEQEFEIVKAETTAVVDRIMSNTESDNEIDLITARNKKFTSKDEIVTYLFLIPIVVATIVPFINAFKSKRWELLNIYIRESYESLDMLPGWYPYVVAMIVVDVLGFRSFMRKVFEKWFDKKDKGDKFIEKGFKK